MNNKINTLIQFALRSRAIVYKQVLQGQINRNKIHLIIIAKDASSNTIKEFNFKNVPVITYLDKEELGIILNKDSVAVFGISNPNLAKQINKLMKEEV